jgi:predicted phosphodiesterase
MPEIDELIDTAAKLPGDLRAAHREIRRLVAALDKARLASARPVQEQQKRSRTVKGLLRVAIPDVHGAHHDPEAVGALIHDLRRLRPDEIVILGDFLDCGGFLAQHQALGFVAETSYSYEDDIAAGNQILDRIQKAAPDARIWYIEGNHEHRVERWAVTQALRHQQDAALLMRAIAPANVLRLKQRGIVYVRQDEGKPQPGFLKLGKCWFTHGFSTSKHAASAHVRSTAVNLVYGHTHRADIHVLNILGVGLVGGFSPGCLAKRQPLWMHGKPTEWSHGYHLQFVDQRTGEFTPINVPIVRGRSLIPPMLSRMLK